MQSQFALQLKANEAAVPQGLVQFQQQLNAMKKQVLDQIKTIIKDCEMKLVIDPAKLTDRLMQRFVDEMHGLSELREQDLATEFQTDKLVDLAGKLKKGKS